MCLWGGRGGIFIVIHFCAEFLIQVGSYPCMEDDSFNLSDEKNIKNGSAKQ